jgi:hypothetical protein
MSDYLAANRHATLRDRSPRTVLALAASTCIAIGLATGASAESKTTELKIRSGASRSAERSKSKSSPVRPPRTLRLPRPAAPVDAATYRTHRLRTSLQEANFQAPAQETAPGRPLQLDLAKNPCAAMDEKPLTALGIAIASAPGKLPDDPATACWEQLNQSVGPLAAARCWPMHVFNWDATCLCHRPLYFEQINLERHGYGCCETLQPLASAAHFFATIPALPYCMAVECPCECVYTLGHYRPGSCPPWRCHWPPCSPLAAAAEGGVWTGMIFLIP